jgi:polysaccharide export outer membrane protein
MKAIPRSFSSFRFLKNVSLYLFLLFLLSSCVSRKNLVYFQDAKVADTVTEEMKQAQQRRIERIRIQPYDILDIRLSSPDEKTNQMFNNIGGGQRGGNQSARIAGAYGQGFSVQKDGSVKLPLVGEVNVLNLTIPEAEQLIEDQLSEYVRDPFIQAKFLNYKIFVLGEVKQPGLITINNESATVMEAIANAGGLGLFARRENVRVFRGPTDNFVAHEMDLTSVSSMDSPGYYLKPYDIIYVEPLRRKTVLSNVNTINAIVGILNTSLSFLFIFLSNN